MNQRGSAAAGIFTGLALIIAVLALALAWTAYNRTSDTTLGDRIQRQVDEAVPDVDVDVNEDEDGDNDATSPAPAPAPATDDNTTETELDTTQ